MKKIFFIFFSLFINPSFASGFSCQKIVEKNDLFLHCLNNVKNYPRPLHFYYPNNLDTSESVNLNLHFQGYNINGFDPIKNFGNLLVQSGLNSILVVPESLGRCETYNDFFPSKQNGIGFIKSIVNMNNFKINTLSFSGHSGAYQALRSVFSYSHLSSELDQEIIGAGLFDATYSNVDSIINFTNNHSDFVFFDAYIIGAKGSASRISIELKNEYEGSNNFYFYPVDSTGDSIFAQHFNLLQIRGIKSFLGLLKSKKL